MPSTLFALGARLAVAAPQRSRRDGDHQRARARSARSTCWRSQLLEMFPFIPIGGDVRVTVGIFSYNGAITMGLNGDYDAMPDLYELGAHIEGAISDLTAAATGAAASGEQAAEPPEATTAPESAGAEAVEPAVAAASDDEAVESAAASSDLATLRRLSAEGSSTPPPCSSNWPVSGRTSRSCDNWPTRAAPTRKHNWSSSLRSWKTAMNCDAWRTRATQMQRTCWRNSRISRFVHSADVRQRHASGSSPNTSRVRATSPAICATSGSALSKVT